MRRGWCASVLGAAILALGAPATAAAARGPWLVVTDVTHARVLHRSPVAAGQRLVLSYVHSSEHVAVRGTFSVAADGALVAEETAFAGFGPGLPEPRGGEAWRVENGMFVVPAAADRLAELRLRVAPFTAHRLRTPSGDDLDLSALTGGASVSIRVAR